MFCVKNQFKAQLGKSIEYRHISSFSFKPTKHKKNKVETLIKSFFNYINRNPQTVNLLINVAITYGTLATWIIRYLIIIHK